jgi:hypothetical protein
VFIVSFGCPGQYAATRERTQARKCVNISKPATGFVRVTYCDNMLRRAPSTWALTWTFQRPVFSAVWGVHPMLSRHDCPTISARDDAGAREPSYENDDNARQRWRAGWVFKLSATNLINFLSRNGGRGYNRFQARFQGV